MKKKKDLYIMMGIITLKYIHAWSLGVPPVGAGCHLQP